MPRQARLDSPGTLHHVMIRGIERIVEDDWDRRDFVRRLGALTEETGTLIYAWALMSNHAHLLLCSGAMGLAKFMRRLLTGYAVSYNLRHRRHGHVFSESLQIDCLRRRQLLHRTGALHSLKSVKGGVGQGFKEIGEISVLRTWNDSRNAGKPLARQRERASAVREATIRSEGGIPGNGAAAGAGRGWTDTIGRGMV